MKAKERTRLFWRRLEETLKNGTEDPKVFINRVGNLCLDGGPLGGSTIPPKVASLLPAELVAEAKRRAVEVAIEREADAEKYRQELEAARVALDARLDDRGFTLLAGENTDVVCRGTLRDCRDSLHKVVHLPRDSWSHLGCWVITDPQFVEVEAGHFTRHGLI